MDSLQRVSEFPNTCSRGKFDGCEGRIRPFLDDTLECVSESIMLQTTCIACAGGKMNKGEFRRCHSTHKNFPRVVTGPENADSKVERRHSLAAPGLGGHVYVFVGDDDGNWSF